ncbi:hypothetical protein V1477_020802 [Vespula maculifrons]|uniref:Uncharacterized protein n=1 Tax=Vespula maculifrons TaxID=7453 RepID=A0ABD2AMX8_VESMC
MHLRRPHKLAGSNFDPRVGYLRSGTWYFDGGQPEVNLRFTRQYRLLLAPPHTAPACSAAMYRDAPAERERGRNHMTILMMIEHPLR